MAEAMPPDATHLPLDPRPVAVSALSEAVKNRAGSLSPYPMSTTDFDVAFITPVHIYGAKDQARRPVMDFGSWSEYFADVSARAAGARHAQDGGGAVGQGGARRGDDARDGAAADEAREVRILADACLLRRHGGDADPPVRGRTPHLGVRRRSTKGSTCLILLRSVRCAAR